VVVAVDGAYPPTVDVARGLGAEVVEIATNAGSYQARNAALDFLMQGDAPDVVIFTDADCVATPGWVQGHVSALEHADLSGGAVRFTFRHGRPSPAEWVDATRHLKQDVYVAKSGFAATCNLAVRGSVAQGSRFNGHLRTGGDAEFCKRLTTSGARLVYTPDAVVEHPARHLPELLVKIRRLSEGLERQLREGLDYTPPSARPSLTMWRRARAAGHGVGPVWGIAACLLDWSINVRITWTARRNGRGHA
jgi:glycosyltransferase involved in cell wall biosynthesis